MIILFKLLLIKIILDIIQLFYWLPTNFSTQPDKPQSPDASWIASQGVISVGDAIASQLISDNLPLFISVFLEKPFEEVPGSFAILTSL